MDFAPASVCLWRLQLFAEQPNGFDSSEAAVCKIESRVEVATINCKVGVMRNTVVGATGQQDQDCIGD